jgi:hypothetical protein
VIACNYETEYDGFNGSTRDEQVIVVVGIAEIEVSVEGIHNRGEIPYDGKCGEVEGDSECSPCYEYGFGEVHVGEGVRIAREEAEVRAV